MPPAIKTFFGKYWHTLLAVVVLLVIIYLVYRAGKKTLPTVVSDTGALSQADIDKAASIAGRLKDDLSGLNLGHDDTIYLELAQTSNTVFQLVFVKYKQLTNTSLVADINSDYFYGWDVIDVIINRANALNIA